jgi:hypothetical protein
MKNSVTSTGMEHVTYRRVTYLERSVRRAACGVRRASAVIANVPSSPILVTLMMEAILSSETSFRTTSTLRNVPEDSILHSHRRENLRFTILLIIAYFLLVCTAKLQPILLSFNQFYVFHKKHKPLILIITVREHSVP